jgi:3-phosphoshikimate 1-carboxyvinyltransferase
VKPLSAVISRKANALFGDIIVPGDKSVSHRALMLGSVAIGKTHIEGLLEGEDVLVTANAMQALGAQISREKTGRWTVIGRGVGGLNEPNQILDMGNSGTAVRLLIGLVGTQPFSTTFTGDESLNRRPMERVMGPLRQMGAQFTSRSGGRLPITVSGNKLIKPIEYELPVASAQVKSAILFAGLNAPGKTTVIEQQPTRDHSERMLRHFGAAVKTKKLDGGGIKITLTGQPELEGQDITIPADISSAAFPIAAALIIPGSNLLIRNVGMNPLRAGLIETLQKMGAKITINNQRGTHSEPIADLRVEASVLHGINVPASHAPSMIDEYPVLSIIAACAKGTTHMEGLAELRVKESDRLAAMATGLTACGVGIKETESSLTVHGSDLPIRGGALIEANLDHRIAMAFSVLGMITENPVTIDDGSPIATSFPGYIGLMNGLGAKIETPLSK